MLTWTPVCTLWRPAPTLKDCPKKLWNDHGVRLGTKVAVYKATVLLVLMFVYESCQCQCQSHKPASMRSVLASLSATYHHVTLHKTEYYRDANHWYRGVSDEHTTAMDRTWLPNVVLLYDLLSGTVFILRLTQVLQGWSHGQLRRHLGWARQPDRR